MILRQRRTGGRLFATLSAASALVATGCWLALSGWPVRAAESAPADSKGLVQSPPVEPVHRDVTLGGKAPAENDTLLLAYPDDPDTVNPLNSNDTVSEALMRQVYESLADRKFSNPDVWEPMLAESWTFDPATHEYTIHLRKGVKWHPIKLPNGDELPAKEFTARDVKFTFDCILNPFIEDAATRSYYENAHPTSDADKYKIKVSLVRGDPYAIKIKWLTPYFLADEFTLGVPIFPMHVFSVDTNGRTISRDFSSKEFADGFNNHWANRQMCGTGPMIFKEWVKEQRVVLERNPDYWGAPFYFSRIFYRYVSNPNTMVQQVLQNDIDAAPISEKDQYFHNLDYKTVKAGKVRLEKFDYPQYRYLGYNLKRDFFKDNRVRWAIGHAIPVDDIIDKIFRGLAVRITGPFLPGSPTNDASLKPLAYDLDESRKLLDEAGWKMEPGESVRSKMVEGQKVVARFDLMVFADSPTYQAIAAIVQDNCRRIGVEVTISPAKWALMLQKLRKKDYDATILGWAMSWKDDPYQIWSGSQADVPESSNSGGYQNPEVDKLIDELRITMDPAQQIPIYHKINDLIYDDQPYTFLYSEKDTAGYDARIQNVKFYKIRPCVDQREWWATTPRIDR